MALFSPIIRCEFSIYNDRPRPSGCLGAGEGGRWGCFISLTSPLLVSAIWHTFTSYCVFSQILKVIYVHFRRFRKYRKYKGEKIPPTVEPQGWHMMLLPSDASYLGLCRYKLEIGILLCPQSHILFSPHFSFYLEWVLMTLNLRKRNFNRWTVFRLRVWERLGSFHCSPPAGCLRCFAFHWNESWSRQCHC